MSVLTEVHATGETRAERAARGKAARAAVPRSSHAGFDRVAGRPTPLELLAGQDRARVPELVPIRYERMSASAFAYFRGAALPMAHDLETTPRTGLTVQSCGDAHLANFGLFASPERRLVFDINDFDETAPGPWEWDVKRLAASLEIAGRGNGFSAAERANVVLAGVGGYRTAMREFAARTALDVWYAHADLESVRAQATPRLDSTGRKRLDRTVTKAWSRDNIGSLSRFTTREGGVPRIASEPPRVVRADELDVEGFDPAELKEQLGGVLRAYRGTLEPERRALLDRYALADIARMVVGVGSVGTRCWMLLLLGNDEHDPLFLQAKEAGPSVLEQFTGASGFANHGQRVIVGQRLMQTVSDIFLGWVRVSGIDGEERDFYVRQLRDAKGSATVENMTPAMLSAYGDLCGWTLARAHARSGDGIAIAAYLGSGPVFDHAIHEFALAYAEQNERDYAALCARTAS
ncbi:DUF2252 domain-containing protein [Amycolatopsis sp.]|uniref:DUF2252 domain-containing protein n=1 Tax=Amycolatopsis sp. TaxID=37632 RepID=UPI002C15D902|nr:DUF2252 domain-containing protein [Amycolatopsis sp.]HVV14544.1 DUF2252 domain-containing protein [Amycolatopsis sp.]